VEWVEWVVQVAEVAEVAEVVDASIGAHDLCAVTLLIPRSSVVSGGWGKLCSVFYLSFVFKSGSMSDTIWYEDLSGFITEHNFFNILPQHYMGIEGKINAVVRFTIYLGVLLALVMADYRYLFIGLVAAMISVIVYENEKKRKVAREAYMDENGVKMEDDKLCAKPTIDNPFMNVLITDIADHPERPRACDVSLKKNQAAITSKFHDRMFRDVNDIYDNSSSQRQYYTAAVTTIPNDQTAFAEWLYGKAASCKQGNGTQCLNNVYTPLNR
jgi:hypothetical protein